MIRSGQLIDTYRYADTGDTADFIFGKVDMNTFEMIDEPVTLYYDADLKSYFMPEDEYLGAFIVEGGESEPDLYTYCTYLGYDDLSRYQYAGKYDYYYDETTPYEANVGMKTDIDVYRNDKAILTTCLLPVYKDAMFALESMEDGSQRLYSMFLADDNLLASGADGNVTQTLDYVDFVYDPSDGSYTLPSDQGLVGLFATVDEETGEYVYFSNSIYANLSLVPSGPAGIGGVETSGKGAAVATEYYDLSGRRISAAARGVSVKVEKYADGTSKAVKVVK